MDRKLLLSGVVLFVLLCSSLVISVEASSMWNQTYGGTGYDWACSVVATSDGGYSITGTTDSFGAGGTDFWLVKTDAFGNMEWNRTYGGTGNEEARSLIATSDGGYAIAGTTDSFGAGGTDFWLVKTDVSGNMQWNRTYGGTGNDMVRTLVALSDGEYAVAGYTSSFGAGGEDTWLIKTDTVGNIEWNRTYGGTGNEEAWSLIATSDGGYALAGAIANYSWLLKTDAVGIMEWNRTYAIGIMEWNETYRGTANDIAYSLVATSDGGYAVAGTTLYSTQFSSWTDEWLVKTDGFGAMEWNQTYGGIFWDGIHSLVVTSDGGYALAGAIADDFWLVKTDALGNIKWNQTYGGDGIDWACSLIATSDGGYALAGWTESFGSGSNDFWLVKTDALGVPEYSSWLIPSLVLTATVFILINKKRLLRTARAR